METPPKTLDDVLTMQEAMRLLQIPKGQNMRIYRLLDKNGWWTGHIGQTRIIERAPLESIAGETADVPPRPIPIDRVRIWKDAAAELGCSNEWLCVLSGWRPERQREAVLHPVLFDDIHVWRLEELQQYARRNE